MAPSTTVLEAKLRSAVEEVYADEETRETLTVRLIRDKVEDELDLQKGFFVTPEWKDKSKELIKTWAVSSPILGFAKPRLNSPAIDQINRRRRSSSAGVYRD